MTVGGGERAGDGVHGSQAEVSVTPVGVKGGKAARHPPVWLIVPPALSWIVPAVSVPALIVYVPVLPARSASVSVPVTACVPPLWVNVPAPTNPMDSPAVLSVSCPWARVMAPVPVASIVSLPSTTEG